MKFVSTNILDCTVVEMDRYFDDRGFFEELFEKDKYLDHIQAVNWKQANWSVSKKNVLRGIHIADYGKLLTCVSGKIWDVVIDLREDSSTYMNCIAAEFSAEEPHQIYIPAGCGHGFLALEDNSSVIYLTSDLYAKKGEKTVFYNHYSIPWPGKDYILSEKDTPR